MKRLMSLAWIAPIALLACTPPVEAPDELSDLTLYLYANFDSESGEELIAGAPNLEAYFETVDLAADAKDRSVTLPTLTSDDLGGAAAPADADPEAQVPVAVTAKSVNDMDTQLELIADPNQVCIANNGYVYYMRDWDTDPSCFADGSCDRLEAIAEIRYESIIADLWFDEHQHFRRVELDDGRVVVYERSWSDKQFLSDNEMSSWDQRYALNVWIPEEGDTSKTWRFIAFWSSVQIPGISDDAYANLAVDGIDDGFVNEDAFVAGEDCSNDRDRENDRP